MENSWQEVKLGQVLGKSGYIRGPFGSALRRNELQPSGIPVYEQQHAIYDDRTFRYFIDDEKHKELSRFTVKPNDLIISCSGTLGRVSIIQENDPTGIISQALLLLRPDTRLILPKFLYYFFRSPKGFQSIVSVSSGSVQVNIAKRSDVENVTIDLPPLPEQRAIAEILGALDDKIELNRRMNRTLESMARAVFRQWFVENKEVNGWKVGKLGDLCASTIGGDWGEEQEFEDSVPVICLRGVDLENLRRDGYSDDAPVRWIKKSSLEKRRLSDCDILIAGSGIGPVGKPLWVSPEIIKAYSHPVVYSNFVKRFRAKSTEFAVYIDRILFNMRESNQIWDYINGTSIPNLDDKGLLEYVEITIPPVEKVKVFYDFITPIYTKLYNQESRTLASLRDNLLPKLMRGEVRVRE